MGSIVQPNWKVPPSRMQMMANDYFEMADLIVISPLTEKDCVIKGCTCLLAIMANCIPGERRME